MKISIILICALLEWSNSDSTECQNCANEKSTDNDDYLTLFGGKQKIKTKILLSPNTVSEKAANKTIPDISDEDQYSTRNINLDLPKEQSTVPSLVVSTENSDNRIENEQNDAEKQVINFVRELLTEGGQPIDNIQLTRVVSLYTKRTSIILMIKKEKDLRKKTMLEEELNAIDQQISEELPNHHKRIKQRTQEEAQKKIDKEENKNEDQPIQNIMQSFEQINQTEKPQQNQPTEQTIEEKINEVIECTVLPVAKFEDIYTVLSSKSKIRSYVHRLLTENGQRIDEILLEILVTLYTRMMEIIEMIRNEKKPIKTELLLEELNAVQDQIMDELPIKQQKPQDEQKEIDEKEKRAEKLIRNEKEQNQQINEDRHKGPNIPKSVERDVSDEQQSETYTPEDESIDGDGENDQKNRKIKKNKINEPDIQLIPQPRTKKPMFNVDNDDENNQKKIRIPDFLPRKKPSLKQSHAEKAKLNDERSLHVQALNNVRTDILKKLKVEKNMYEKRLLYQAWIVIDRTIRDELKAEINEVMKQDAKLKINGFDTSEDIEEKELEESYLSEPNNDPVKLLILANRYVAESKHEQKRNIKNKPIKDPWFQGSVTTRPQWQREKARESNGRAVRQIKNLPRKQRRYSKQQSPESEWVTELF